MEIDVEKLINSAEFQYLLYINEQYKSVRTQQKIILNERQFKLDLLLKKEENNNFLEISTLHIKQINDMIRLIDLKNLDLDYVNDIRKKIMSLSELIIQSAKEFDINISTDDDLPF